LTEVNAPAGCDAYRGQCHGSGSPDIPSHDRHFFDGSLLIFFLICVCLLPGSARADEDLRGIYRDFFPSADELGDFRGEPLAAPVYAHNSLQGYLCVTSQVAPIPGYSGKPITTLVGIDLHGNINGARIIRHEEPILAVGISDRDLAQYLAQFSGLTATDKVQVGAERAGYKKIDGISGATITVMVLNASIMRSARLVAESRGLPQGGVQPAGMSDRPPDEAIWVAVWLDRSVRIGVLVVALLSLTLILVFQDYLARHPRLLLTVRDGYLLFTLFFIGWYALAQLSVVNVLTFISALMHDFSWNAFLIDPMMFILWTFVAVTLLLWGRGVYCGWLCPFGALQELVNQLARRFKVRQWEFPAKVHERLWAIKYIILLLLFGISLQSVDTVLRYIEIEPFKTAITMRFMREWGFVIYAVALVLISIVNRKFYCKYLCPLGAALAIPARLRLFDWLRRYKECGRPCQVCAVECEVQAVSPTGVINANECHYCLDCQVTYYNERKCPPLVERRKRRERGVRAREVVRGMESDLGPSGLDEVEGARVAPPVSRKRRSTDLP
jgi:polyferredoxin